MQKVSKEYKASMKDSLRERAYIMISFGVVNQEAQAKAKVDSGSDLPTSPTRTTCSMRELTMWCTPLWKRTLPGLTVPCIFSHGTSREQCSTTQGWWERIWYQTDCMK